MHFNCALSESKRSMNRVIGIKRESRDLSCLKSIYQLGIRRVKILNSGIPTRSNADSC